MSPADVRAGRSGGLPRLSPVLMSPVLTANLRSAGPRLWAAGAAVVVSVAFVVTSLLLVDSFNRMMEAQAAADAAGADLVLDVSQLPVSPPGAQESDGGDAGAPDDGADVPQVRQDDDLAAEIEQLDGVATAEAAGTQFFPVETDGLSAYLMAGALPQTAEISVDEGEAPQTEDQILLAEDFADSYALDVGDSLTLDVAQLNPEQTDAEQTDVEQTDVEQTDADTSEATSLDYMVSGLAEGPQSSTSGWFSPAGVERLPDAGMSQAPDTVRVALDGSAQGDPTAQEDVQQQVAELLVALADQGQVEFTQDGDAAEPRVEQQADGHLAVADVQIYTNQQIIDTWVQEQTGQSDTLLMIGLGFGAIAVFVAGLVISNTFQVLVASRARTMALLRAVGATAGQLKRATLAEGTMLGLIGGLIGLLLGFSAAAGLSWAARALWMDSFEPTRMTPTAGLTGLTVGVVVTVLATMLPALKAGRTAPMQALRPADVEPVRRRPPVVRRLAGGLLTLVGLAAVLVAALTYAPLVGVLGAILGFIGVLVLGRLLIPRCVGWLGRALSVAPALGVPAKLAAQNARQVPGRTAATTSALLVGVTLVATMTVGATTAQTFMSEELTERHPVDGVVGSVSAETDQALQESGVVSDYATISYQEGELSAADRQRMDEVSRLQGVVPEDLEAVDQELEAGQDITVMRVSDSATTADVQRLMSDLEPHTDEVFVDSALERASYGQIIDTVLVVVLVLLAASVLVAVIGVSNTLALSVFERGREAALLRSLGMGRGGVGAMVSLEAVLMAVVALLLGSALGTYFGWAGVTSLVAREDMDVMLTVPWGRMALLWGVTAVAAVVASALPARALARTQPAAGLSVQ